MQINSLDINGIIQNIVSSNLEAVVKLYLLNNPKLVHIYIRRLALNIKNKLVQLQTLINSIFEYIPYLHRQEIKADSQVIESIRLAGAFNQGDTLSNEIKKLISSFAELRENNGLIGLSSIDACEALLTIKSAILALSASIQNDVTNLTNAKINWTNSNYKKRVLEILKPRLDSYLENILSNVDSTSRISTASGLTAYLEMINISNQLDVFNSKDYISFIKSLNSVATSSATGEHTSSTIFSLDIGNITYAYNYPVDVNTSSVYIISTLDSFTVSSNGALYLQFTTNNLPLPKAIDNKPEGVAMYEIPMGVYNTVSLISLLNSINILGADNVSRKYINAYQGPFGELIIAGVPEVTNISVIGTVVGTLVADVYTPPKAPIHTALGFLPGQTSKLDTQHLVNFLLSRGIQATLTNKLNIIAAEPIKINSGVAQDIGMQDAELITSSYDSSDMFNIGDIVGGYKVVSAEPLKLENDVYVNLVNTPVLYISSSESARLINVEYNLNTDTLAQLIIKTCELTGAELALSTEAKKQLIEVNKFISLYTPNWELNVKDRNLIQALDRVLEEKGASLYIVQLNTCQFDQLNELNRIDKLLTKIEEAGRS